MDKVRLAAIGAGNQCTNQLMPAIAFIEEIELVAECDLKGELAERNARDFGALAASTDLEKMLDEEAPDAAMVVGPPQMHEEVGIAVLAHGCHLFVEKPSSPTIEGAGRLMDAAARARKVGQVGHMMRHADPIRIAWDLRVTEIAAGQPAPACAQPQEATCEVMDKVRFRDPMLLGANCRRQTITLGPNAMHAIERGRPALPRTVDDRQQRLVARLQSV